MPLNPPNLLQKGDTVALLGPASPLNTKAEVTRCIKKIESFGLKVKVYPSATKKHDYLAGTDKQRAADINRATATKSIKGIFCIRGGYGSSRLLKLIDWKAVKEAKKPFVGFSDITSIYGAMHQKANLIGMHAPTPAYLTKKDGDAGKDSYAALEQFLFEGFKGISYRELCGNYFKPRTINKGNVSGTLIGGNLSLVAGLCGTPYFPMPRQPILFIEEVYEKPYKVDRYLTQMENAGLLEKMKGIVLGEFTHCDPSAPDKNDVMTVLKDCLKGYKVPMISGLPVGHCAPSFPLPLGASVELDANKGDLRIK